MFDVLPSILLSIVDIYLFIAVCELGYRNCWLCFHQIRKKLRLLNNETSMYCLSHVVFCRHQHACQKQPMGAFIYKQYESSNLDNSVLLMAMPNSQFFCMKATSWQSEVLTHGSEGNKWLLFQIYVWQDFNISHSECIEICFLLLYGWWHCDHEFRVYIHDMFWKVNNYCVMKYPHTILYL